MVAPLIIGGGLAAIGGMSSAGANKRALEEAAKQAQFRPLALGAEGFGQMSLTRNNAGRVSMSDQQQLFSNLFQQNALNRMTGGGFGQGAMDFANLLGQNLPQMWNQADIAADPSSALAAGNMFGNFAGQNALFGQQQGMNMLGLAQQFGMNPAGANEGIAQQANQFGLAALNNTDFSQLANDQVARMRTLARPAEEQAVNAKFQNLFNRGTLSATSGQRGLGELAQAQEMADIQRINTADTFAQGLKQMNQNFGMGMLGTGLQARAQDANFNAQMASTFGNLGQGMMGFGQQAGGQQFNTALGLNELINTRGQQRVQNALGLMGFGNTLDQSNLNATLGMFGGIRGIGMDLRDLMGMSITGGDARAQAGARQAGFTAQTGFSPLGSFLGGLGSGIMGSFGGKS